MSNTIVTDELSAGLTDAHHHSLTVLSEQLHHQIVGRRAGELLANIGDLPDEGSLWVAPSWAWVHSRINVGRKDSDGSGGRVRMPVRLEWESTPVSIVAADDPQPSCMTWTAVGLGHSGIGTTEVATSRAFDQPQLMLNDASVPTEAILPILDRRALIAALTDLVEAGQHAKWKTLDYLQPFVEKAVASAHAAVAGELAGYWGEYRAVLDRTRMDTITTTLMLGSDENPGQVARLLDRCLEGSTFTKVDPLRYIRVTLHRDAAQEIRRAIADPYIGPKVRKVAASHGLSLKELNRVVELYRETYPRDRLSHKRAEAALTVRPDPMATWWSIEEARS